MLALSDPTRRAILEQLFKGPARVTDLAKPYKMSLNSVSKHIRILERAKLVNRRVSGRDHILSFSKDSMENAVSWIEDRRDAWSKAPTTVEEPAPKAKSPAKPRKAPSAPRKKAEKKPAWKFW